MEVICREDVNTIFWKDEDDEMWKQGKLDRVVQTYDTICEEGELTATVTRYTHLMMYPSIDSYGCSYCGNLIPYPFGEKFDFEYCPYCKAKITEVRLD